MSTNIGQLASDLYKAMSESDNKKPKPYDTQAEVVRVDGNVAYIHIPGGVDETPVQITTSVKPGDMVMARLSGGRAWVLGNSTSPPTDDSTAYYAVNIANNVQKNVVEINNYVVEEIDAQKAVIGDLEADTAKIHNLTADELSATVGYINDITAESITANDIVADHATIDSLDVESMSAAVAYIGDLTAENITANDIVADHEIVNNLDATYASIDLANVNNAWIQNGVIKNGAIADAQIIGVSANKLTAGTIDASNITVTNLNADNITTGTINGQRIGSESITLDKLAEEVPTKEYLDNVAENLQGQIDGQIETWTGTVVPTLNNSPASSWTTAAERKKHVGDIYYVVNAANSADGYTYRFTESGTTYSWTLIKDNQITKALQDIIDIQGDISDIEQFDSQISSWKTDTTQELSSLKTRTSTLETGMGNKVDTSTFNELSQTVDENSASITSLSTTVAGKADSSTVTTLSNTVNSVKQTADQNKADISSLTETVESKADGSTVSTLSSTVNTIQQTANSNSSKISNLTTVLGTNADGTTKAGDIVHRTSAVEQDLSGFKTTVSQTYQTKSAMGNYSTTSQMNTAIEQSANEITQSVSETYQTKSDMDSYSTTTQMNSAINQKANQITTSVAQTYATNARVSTAESSIQQNADNIALKVSQDDVIASINASPESITINANRVNIAGAAIFDSYSLKSETVSNVVIEYAVGNNSSSAPTTGWSSNTPTWTTGKYIWQRTAKTINGSTTYTYTCIQGAKGETGAQGPQGEQGPQGSQGSQGPKGDSALWYFGTALSHTSGTATLSTSSTSGVIVGAMYLNSSKDLVYRCTAISGTTATWTYAGSLVPTTSLAKTQQIYYRSNSSTAPSGPSSIITTVSETNNTWTLTRLPMIDPSSTSYKYCYTCTQYISVSNELITNSTVVADKAHTVIDGGNIITGTVTANAMNASSGTFDTALIPDLSADKITTGTLDASKITVTNLTVGQSQVTGLTAALAGKQAAGDYATNTALNNEVNARKAVYATSSTSGSTQAKAATCANFALYTGASVTVTFSNANTHATPTLNVNSTGAKTIKSYTGAALTEAEYKWAAGAAINFVYDGSYWRMQDSGTFQAKADAAASASAASTSASNASTSATNAASSASTASTKASEASTSATNAASSASTASSKATAAANSASTASTKASEASTSATNAASSASTASTKASEASASATNASNSATAAAEVVDWTVGIIVTAINYSANTATLSVTAYKGGVAQSSGFTRQWYKNSTKITGQTGATLSVTDLSASYTCIIS